MGKCVFSSGLFAPLAGTLVWSPIPHFCGDFLHLEYLVSADTSALAEPLESLPPEVCTSPAELKSATASGCREIAGRVVDQYGREVDDDDDWDVQKKEHAD